MKSTTARKENGFNTVFTPEDFWFTKKDNNIYVISLTSSINSKVSVRSLISIRDQIKSVKLLGTKKSLKWEVSNDKLDIFLPPVSKTNIPGFVLKVELK
jgi:alpha-L-fucosidase